MNWRRKQRDMAELQSDPYFPFYVGRLVGATEMTAWWLQMQPGTEMQEMGLRVGVVVGWFLTDEPEDSAPIKPREEITRVIPPKAS